MRPVYRRDRKKRSAGYVLITMVAGLVVILGLVGLDIDAAYLQFVKMRMQTAADAAAIGAVQEIRLNGAANLAAAAKASAAQNGFTDGQKAVAVTVNRPPLSGYYTNDSSAIEAIVSQNVPTFFMVLMGTPSVTVRARAVARQGSSANCVYALDPAASGSLSATGTVSVQLQCGAYVNSSSASALSVTGNAVVNGTAFNVRGNYSVSNNARISPTPRAGAASVADPLAGLAAPASSGCTKTNFTVSGGTATLCPGVYNNGIAITSQSHVTLSPGTYILKGGGLSISGGSTVTGTGVTIYNSKGTYAYGPISISGGTTVNLSAPTTGPMAGILFFQDRSVVGGAASTFAGGSGSVVTGSLYFPTTALSYSGTSGVSAYTVIVAKTITFSGTTSMNNNYSSLADGSPVKGDALLGE